MATARLPAAPAGAKPAPEASIDSIAFDRAAQYYDQTRGHPPEGVDLHAPVPTERHVEIAAVRC